MTKPLLLLLTICIIFISCDNGSNPSFDDEKDESSIVLTAPATQLGDTVTVTKTIKKPNVEDVVSTYTHTVSTIGTHTIPAVSEDGLTSNTVDVTFDIDFSSSIWIGFGNDQGTPEVSDDIYLRKIINNDVSIITSYLSPNNKDSWIFGSDNTITSFGNGSLTSNLSSFTYSSFTSINDGDRDYIRQ